ETGKKITQSSAPTEYDDLHIPQNFPSVKIMSPVSNQTVGRSLTVEVSASAPRRISRVEFYVDGAYFGSDETDPYRITTELPNLIGLGVHSLKSIAFDDIDNQGSDTVSIQVSENSADDTLSIIDPKHGQTIERTSEIYTIVVSVKKPDDYSSLRVYVDPSGSETRKLIGQQLNPSTVFTTFDWTLPESGTFAIFVEGTTKQGTQIQTAGILVTVKQSSTEGSTQSNLQLF
ncbi:Ig-like domain-containing protein, partial [Candidatus Uhrbacteria bacterium]|nr:Ig-like domain-containing protein [Candidatus Uhrbacteria bacterium]